MKFRIYIVDSYGLVRRGLGALIGAESDMEVCGEAADGATAFEAIMKLRPDVVTAEISLQGNSGIELIKSIRRLDAKIATLAISMCDETVYALRALRAGARGFVSKDADSESILRAIRRVQRGQPYFSDAVEKQLLANLAPRACDPGDAGGPDHSALRSLSDRELEVARLIGKGSTTREIANLLGVSVKTIETHRAHLKKKLALPNATRLMQFCVNWTGETGESPVVAPTNGKANGSLSPEAYGISERRIRAAC